MILRLSCYEDRVAEDRGVDVGEVVPGLTYYNVEHLAGFVVAEVFAFHGDFVVLRGDDFVGVFAHQFEEGAGEGGVLYCGGDGYEGEVVVGY